MNSRDAAYDERMVKALIEATAAEAATAPPQTPVNANDEPDEESEAVLPNNTRKRKRTDDDSVSMKRTRSASATSDRPIMSTVSREDPVSATGSKATPTPSVPPPAPKPRQKRGGGRKSVQVAESVASVEIDEAPPKRPSRAKGANQDSRRSQAKADSASASYPRSHHAYAVAQQPLYTSWNLPDYLAHLEPMLPSDAPKPLEICASGKDRGDISIERGVKVKWPSKRTSIGDMNKRVRSLVEWVGREQASALERGRRKEALVKALEESERGRYEMILQGTSLVQSPLQEKPEKDWLQSPTTKMMEEVMEELIGFQEKFGPGSKSKERGRVVSN